MNTSKKQLELKKQIIWIDRPNEIVWIDRPSNTTSCEVKIEWKDKIIWKDR